MKKILALLLAAMLLISCAALAEQAEGLQKDVLVLLPATCTAASIRASATSA